MTTLASPTRPSAAPLPTVLQPGRGGFGDQLVAMLMFLVLPLDFPMAQPLRVPVLLFIALYALFHYRSVVPVLWAGRWLFALPAFCVLSVLWADAAFPALRHGGLIAIAMGSAAIVAARLDPRQIAVAILLSQGAMALGSLTALNPVWVGGIDGGLAVTGIFPHKNILGQRMLFLMLAAAAIIMGKGYHPMFRLAAMGAIPLAIFLIAKSLSATAVILVFGAVPLAMFLALIWQPADSVRGLRPVIVMAGLAVVPCALLILINGFGIDPISDLLALFGKDATLTGRTVIWAAGNEAIADHPILGVGAGNFWHIDNPSAMRLATQFYVDDANFKFHNVFYEVLVHLGVVGLGIALFVYGGAFRAILQYWWARHHVLDPFFASLLAVFFIRSFTESELFYPLVLGPMLFWVMAFTALAASGLPETKD